MQKIMEYENTFLQFFFMKPPLKAFFPLLLCL